MLVLFLYAGRVFCDSIAPSKQTRVDNSLPRFAGSMASAGWLGGLALQSKKNLLVPYTPLASKTLIVAEAGFEPHLYSRTSPECSGGPLTSGEVTALSVRAAARQRLRNHSRDAKAKRA